MKIFNGKMGRRKKGRGGNTHERSTEEIGGPRRRGGVCGRASFGGTVLEHVVVVIELRCTVPSLGATPSEILG